MDLNNVCQVYGSSVLRRCIGILGNRADAEDAVQEVFVTILTKGEQYRGDAALGSWIYRLTTNLCLNRLRGDKRRQSREKDMDPWRGLSSVDPYQQVLAKGVLHQVLAMGDTLDQEIFIYRYLDGLTQEEIASATGRSRRTVGKRLKSLARRFAQEAK